MKRILKKSLEKLNLHLIKFSLYVKNTIAREDLKMVNFK